VGALALLAGAAACGSDDESAARADVTVDGTGMLSELTKVTVTIPVATTSTVPWLMEDAFGEFEKRNIDLEVRIAESSDSMVLLAKGEIDGIQTGLSAGLLNAIDGGSELRVVMPSGYEPPTGKNGWYVSTDALGGKKFDAAMMEGKSFGSSQGASGTTVLGLSQLLETAGLTLADVTVKTVPSTDTVTALENGALFGGSVLAPLNVTLEEHDSAIQVAPNSPDGYPSGIVIFGPSLMEDNPAVGKAVVSALLATYGHLQGDYVNDPATGPQVAEALDQSWETLKSGGPGKIWKQDPEFPDGYVKSYEEVWRQIPGTLSYDGSIDPADVVDTEYVDWAGQHAD
jgi:ABC-type nitrate/sulfonate/bicarbonate transport system substrate-binding protein